jgi:tricorn protease
MRFPLLVLALVSLSCLASASHARAEEGRLLRMPTIHGDQVVFTYAGDLWTVSRSGGTARRLTTHEGNEFLARISPDGNWIAFTGQYDGNTDVYVMPSRGGEPHRLTFHPGSDQVITWSPDSKEVYFRSSRLSSTRRYDRVFHVPVEGGWPEAVALPICERISFATDGTDRAAFTWLNREFRTWKRYRGGTEEDIWIYDFKAKKSTRMTDWEGTDRFPMWHGNTVYFLSDRANWKLNLWAYDLNTGTFSQVTDFKEYDVRWPSLGGDSIVFENGGWLYVLDLPDGKPRKIDVDLETDAVAARPALTNVSGMIRAAGVSPSAKRVAFAARGEIFTVPAEHGDVRRLTSTPGTNERMPTWSPDGRWVSYFSDATGEYELYVRPQDGSGDARQVTHGRSSFMFSQKWSPDSKKIAFADKTWSLFWVDVESGKVTRADKSEFTDIVDYAWSPDSKWLTYAKLDPNHYGSIWVYSLDAGRATRVTDQLHDDYSPGFGPDGKYLYFLSNRHLNPEFGDFAFEYVLQDATGLFAVSLAADTPRPFPPLSDEETPKSGDEEKGAKDGKGKKGKDKGEEGSDEPAPVVIDFDGLDGRVSEVPVPAGNYSDLVPAEGKLFYLSLGSADTGGGDEEGPPRGNNELRFFDTEKREVKTVLSGIGGYELTPDAAKVLYESGLSWGIVDAAAGQKTGDGRLDTGNLMTMVDPRAEWHEMFVDAWRLERDFYYDPAMHGLDWKAMRARYEPLVDHVASRADLNYVIGELIGELSTSHTYVYGGDAPKIPHVNVGLLGADFSVDRAAGRYRFARIFTHSNWDEEVIAPLARPGVDVNEGDYLLAVNGEPVTTGRSVYAWFQDLAGKEVKLTVNSAPNDKGAREVTVMPVGSEAALRYEAWVAANRQRVYDATDGRVAYIHMPNTAMAGVKRFSRDFYNQTDKEGVILDGRFNSGGFIPDYMVDRLSRPFLGFWSRREGRDFRTPGAAIVGPKVCVTNSWAGSGGDAIPYFFREAGLGPIVGTRTWGGLVGISRGIRLMDGGRVTMPDFGFWIPGKGWQVENHGVDPDYEVINLPEDLLAGKDPQLEKAIELEKAALAKMPPRAKRPSYPTRNDR